MARGIYRVHIILFDTQRDSQMRFLGIATIVVIEKKLKIMWQLKATL